MPPNHLTKTILILEANPKGTQPLRLGKEVSEIKEALQRSERRDYFRLEYQPAASPLDVQRAIQVHTPYIVHFCGHGDGQDGLILEDEIGNPTWASGEGLANLVRFFRQKFPGRLECIILNACYSAVQAEAISQYGSAVIGMPQSIGDKAAIAFAISFYDELATGGTIQTAFDLGRIAMQLYGVATEKLPVLLQNVITLELNESPNPSLNSDLEAPEGVMNPTSRFYILRPSEKKALKLIEQQGITLVIKGSPQTGKSSLLRRMAETAQAYGKHAIILDFQTAFDTGSLAQSDSFFRQFCSSLSDALDLEDRVEEYWNRPLSNAQRCNRYMERYVLNVLNTPLFLAMDEVERIFDSEFRSDFFGMIRAWDSFRPMKPIWKKLDLAIALYSDPMMLIDNLHQSPFNVGKIIDLEDLNLIQLSELNQKHGSQFTVPQLQQLMNLLNGHPYLVRQSLYLVADQAVSPEELFQQATSDQGPFGGHLRLHLRRLMEDPELRRGLLQVLRNQTCSDMRVLFKLQGQGLVKQEGKRILPRCQLYADYFRECLND